MRGAAIGGLPVRVVGACSTAEMLWDWALAEWESSRFGRFYPDRPDVIARLRSGAPYDHSQLFDQRIATTVAGVHAPLLKDVLPARVPWQRVALRPDELAELRILNMREFQMLSPHSPLLRDLTAALEADGEKTRNLPLPRAYREVAASFDPALMRGAPILLAMTPEGPFHVLEGHRRLTTLHARHCAGRLDVAEIAAILGLWPGLKDWPGYRDWGSGSQPL